MLMVDVQSSNVAQVGWMDGELLVVFKGGETYAFDGVPAGVYQQMLCAESVGKFYHSVIKGNYTPRKLEK